MDLAELKAFLIKAKLEYEEDKDGDLLVNLIGERDARYYASFCLRGGTLIAASFFRLPGLRAADRKALCESLNKAVTAFAVTEDARGRGLLLQAVMGPHLTADIAMFIQQMDIIVPIMLLLQSGKPWNARAIELARYPVHELAQA